MFCLHWGGSESTGYLGQEESPPADNRDQGRGLPALLRVLWVSVSNEEQHGEEGIAGWLTGASILVDRHPASPWRLTVHLPQPCSCKSLCSWWRMSAELQDAIPVPGTPCITGLVTRGPSVCWPARFSACSSCCCLWPQMRSSRSWAPSAPASTWADDSALAPSYAGTSTYIWCILCW